MPSRPLLVLAALALALPARGGDVVGQVRFVGAVPARATHEVTKDKPTCGTTQPDESLLVEGGGLANVVVRVQGVATPAQQPARLVLDQRGCRFHPRVQVAPVGSTLVLENGDPILHGVRGTLEKRTAFDVPMPEQGERVETKLARPGLVRVGCDVHSWMQAFVWVADGPAAVSGRDGTFRLVGLPAGTYAVTAWHERLGERTGQVTVPASGDARLALAFGG